LRKKIAVSEILGMYSTLGLYGFFHYNFGVLKNRRRVERVIFSTPPLSYLFSSEHSPKRTEIPNGT
jgi:hypothetical protein